MSLTVWPRVYITADEAELDAVTAEAKAMLGMRSRAAGAGAAADAAADMDADAAYAVAADTGANTEFPNAADPAAAPGAYSSIVQQVLLPERFSPVKAALGPWFRLAR